MLQGTVVLKVKAEDGDKGNPRPIGYAIMADSSPFAPFFSMDPNSGKSTHSYILYYLYLKAVALIRYVNVK